MTNTFKVIVQETIDSKTEEFTNVTQVEVGQIREKRRNALIIKVYSEGFEGIWKLDYLREPRVFSYTGGVTQ